MLFIGSTTTIYERNIPLSVVGTGDPHGDGDGTGVAPVGGVKAATCLSSFQVTCSYSMTFISNSVLKSLLFLARSLQLLSGKQV